MKKPIVLIVLDGWGEAPDGYPAEFNAIQRANLATYRALRERYPWTLIKTSGNAVGLPEGVMGNSEVGHMNMGAGRIIWQEITRIDKAIEKDDFRSVGALFSAIKTAKETGKRLHLTGLVSDGAVHSVDRHYFAILRLARDMGLTSDQVVFHIVTDGRDTPPKSGIGYVAEIEKWIAENKSACIGTVSGRYYAMDRDTRWDRTKLAYDALVDGVGIPASSATAAVQDAYEQGENDEFIKPRVIVRDGKPVATFEDGDQVIFFNYRADRVRQMTKALTEDDFTAFPRRKVDVRLVTMTLYREGLKADVAFPPQFVRKSLGEVFSALGKTQLRIAETEKYPHVSFFFSGGLEKEFEGESRVLIPSTRDVPTYDLKPEMSAFGITEALLKELDDPGFDLVINNFANADMVGHTGIIPATIKACETVDQCLSRIIPKVLSLGGTAIITADHGNAEQLWDYESNSPQTQHTTNPVPMIIVNEDIVGARLKAEGRLCDIAPTILKICNLEAPKEMDGNPLL